MLGEARAEQFVQVATIGHIVTLSPAAASVEGHTDALTFKETATGWVESDPIIQNNEEETMAALRHTFGPKDAVGFVPSDGS